MHVLSRKQAGRRDRENKTNNIQIASAALRHCQYLTSKENKHVICISTVNVSTVTVPSLAETHVSQHQSLRFSVGRTGWVTFDCQTR